MNIKLKASKKDIKDSGLNIIKVGYCELQGLLSIKEAFAYSAGRNGWACDYYDVGDLIISTGYDPIGTNISYSLIKEYEKKAQTIKCHNTLSYEERTKIINDLLDDFILKVKEMLKNDKKI